MRIIVFIILIFFGLSYFIGISPFPWTASSQDYLWFLGLILFLVLFYKKNVNVPILLIPLFIICLIPFIQFIFGQVYYFSTTFFSFCFLFGFLASILYGYNSTRLAGKENIIKYIAYFFSLVGFFSSLLAIAQWLQISHPYMLNLSHNRPYANLGQPNQLATLLILSICSLLFLYERMRSKSVFLILSLPIIVWALALTQSRTTWVTLFILFIIYIVKKVRFEKKSTAYIALISVFIYLFIFIFNAEISEYLNLVKPIPMQERLNGGVGRIEMWKHMYYAAMQQPWLGYGWFQTTIAQLEGVLIFKNEGNLSSAHNIVIDLVLWVGIPFTVLIIGYGLYLIKRIFLSIHSLPQLYVFMMMLCILVHAQLEFPLYYSYFLFPLGFFIGVLLIESNCKYFLLNEKSKHIIFLISICFYALIFKQYDQWLSDLGYASGMENTGKLMHKKSILFSQFSDRADFIVAKIDQNYTRLELEFFEYYVKSQPTEYNLYKIAQIFYFNENINRANYYLEVYNALYNKNALFKDLSKINTEQDIVISSLFEKNSSKPNPNMK